ncbi:MAG: cytochrome c [Pseudomonadota bacterium]
MSAAPPPGSTAFFRLLRVIGALLALTAGLLAWIWLAGVHDFEDPASAASQNPALPQANVIVRGEYLTRAGNCMTCHTSRGGASYAGGRGIETPFGTVFSSNLTPDPDSGLGKWSANDFWRAIHHGRSQDGRLLYPAFPYTSYTLVSREDSDAMYAYLRTLPPVAQPAQPHTLRWPFSTQPALAAWRALYFKPDRFEPDPAQNADWNRGAYLVRGLGHCAACHSARNALGGSSPLDLAGGLIPMQNWYAPSLTRRDEASVAGWPTEDVISLFKTGVAPHASALGPMAEVVLHSTQFLSEPDLQSMAVFLKSLAEPADKQAGAEAVASSTPAAAGKVPLSAQQGARLFDKHCAQCHGDRGEGVRGIYPALAGNRAVTMPSTANLVQIVLNGGYSPATEGNPRPYGMPPFVLELSDVEVASVLTFIRTSWGNRGGEVTAFDVNRARTPQ